MSDPFEYKRLAWDYVEETISNNQGKLNSGDRLLISPYNPEGEALINIAAYWEACIYEFSDRLRARGMSAFHCRVDNDTEIFGLLVRNYKDDTE